MKKAKVVYIDLDDTIADFYSAAVDPVTFKIRERMMWDHNFFLNLEPIPGAKGAIYELTQMGFDIWLLSQPLAESPESYFDKVKWVHIHFPQLYKKLILTQNKGLHIGDYLIDDNKQKWKEKFEQNGGKFIHFNYGGYNGGANNTNQLWRQIVQELSKENPYIE